MANRPKDQHINRPDLGLGYTITARPLGRPLGKYLWVASPTAFFWLTSAKVDIVPRPVVGETYGETSNEAIEEAVKETNEWLDQHHQELPRAES